MTVTSVHIIALFPRVYSPLIPRCPFIRRPTDGDTSAKGLSARRDGLFSEVAAGSATASTLSAHTASTMESMLDERGRREFKVSLLQKKKA
jgi:hypothetical protein